MKQLIKINLLLLTLFLSIQVHAAKPFGFERWTRPDFSSHEIGVGCESLYASYSNENTFVPHKEKGDIFEHLSNRLIDIEIRDDANDGLIFDAVTVSNTNEFRRKSYLACELTEKHIHNFLNKKHRYGILDVERYSINGEERWAAIIQDNVVPLHQTFIVGSTIEAINNEANREDWRVLDIDVYPKQADCSRHTGREACGGYSLRYSALLVKNVGDDEIDWLLREFEGDEGGGPNNTPTQITFNFQLVDRERKVLPGKGVKFTNSSDWDSVMVFVDSKQSYKTDENIPLTKIDPTSYADRIIDLESHIEINPLPFQMFKWYTVIPRF